MDYSSQTCVNRFTECQKQRVSCVLHGVRNSLTYSIGCEPACDLVEASYDHTGSNMVELDEAINFTSDPLNFQADHLRVSYDCTFLVIFIFHRLLK